MGHFNPRTYQGGGVVATPLRFFYIFQDDKTSAPVVQKVDNAIHRINLYPLDIVQLVFLIIIYWIVMYPVDSAIHLLNNWGLA